MIPAWGWLVIVPPVAILMLVLVAGMTGLDTWLYNRWRKK